MYDRVSTDGRALNDSFIVGVYEFVRNAIGKVIICQREESDARV